MPSSSGPSRDLFFTRHLLRGTSSEQSIQLWNSNSSQLRLTILVGIRWKYTPTRRPSGDGSLSLKFTRVKTEAWTGSFFRNDSGPVGLCRALLHGCAPPHDRSFVHAERKSAQNVAEF